MGRASTNSAKQLDFDAFVKDNAPTLTPPVANRLLFHEFLKVMIVGGPNQRKDYHMQAGEEFFWQMKGTLTLNIILGGVFRQVEVPQGHCFLLPSNIPHSPQRPSGSLGVVIERGHEHNVNEVDRVRW
jgi:3-hydroxyanthranilate 3,4-dioxygenase